MRLHPQVRTALTLAVLALVLLLALVWGVTKLTAPMPSLSGSGQTPAATCTTRTVPKGTVVRPPQVTVSVFNAGTTNGLATRLLNALQKRGFAPGEIGNAPAGTKVTGAQVWSGPATNPAVQLVARQFGAGTRVVAARGKPLGDGVVVVVGNGAVLGAAPNVVVARAAAAICSPSA